MRIELKLTIHDTPAALRFGGDGYFVTFAGTEEDKTQAAKLMLLNKTALKVTVEVDEESVSECNDGSSQTQQRPTRPAPRMAGG